MKSNVSENVLINPLADLPKLNGVIDIDSIQYIRKYEFIKKLKCWMNENFYRYTGEFDEGILAQFDSIEDCIKNFKNYMKEE